MKPQHYTPPAKEGDDPRGMLYVCVRDLQIDPVVQRDLQRGSPVWRQEWNWSKAEVPTVADRDGILFVIEGQNRVAKRMRDFPDSHMWVVLAKESGREAEAGIALGITKGRKTHTPMDRWKLAVEAGSGHETAAEQVLGEMGLSVVNGHSRTGIAAVTALGVIMRNNGRTPPQGAAMLEKVLGVITKAYGPGDEYRFEASILRGVLDVLEANPDRKVDPDRLAAHMKDQLPTRWIALAKDSARIHGEPNVWQFLARELIRAYNRGLRKDGPRYLTWSRDAR